MLIWFYTSILCLSALALSYVGSLALRGCAVSLSTPQGPGARDNHTQPTPNGGGVALMISVIGFLIVAGMGGPLAVALILLLVASAWDDFSEGLSPFVRLAVHFIASVMIVSTLEIPSLVPETPVVVTEALFVLALVWFINGYRVMDGIDEMTALETATLTLGVGTLAIVETSLSNTLAYDAFIIFSAVLGFWIVNRHPARILMGESGAVPLGALTGWLLISIGLQGYWPFALILPAYYLVDLGLTLLLRLIRGKKPWGAHDEHAYQHYVRAGHSPRTATRIITALNGVLLILAGLTILKPDYFRYCIAISYTLTLAIYLFFKLRSTVDAAPSLVTEEGAESDDHAVV